jgi:hypothetical protein
MNNIDNISTKEIQQDIADTQRDINHLRGRKEAFNRSIDKQIEERVVFIQKLEDILQERGL